MLSKFVAFFFSLFCDIVLERSQSIFEGFLNSGTASKSWFAIFSLLQRLRQACDHVSLTVTKSAKSESGDSRVEVDSVSEVVGGDDVDNDVSVQRCGYECV